MKTKKITAILLSLVLMCTSFSACSSGKSDETAATTTKVVEVTDKDDDVKVNAEEEKDTTIELTDKEGNILTVVPIFNSDGVTVIAGYIEAAKDKSGKELTQKEYPYIKTVAAVDIVKTDDDTSYDFKYSADNKFITMTALSDDKGYIIAIQDAIDIDGDKDTKEYFKVVTKLDSSSNLFIKLDKDDKGNLINVNVQTDSDKKTVTVTDSTGKKITATDTKQAKNLTEVVEEDKKEKEENKNNNSNQDNNKNQDTGNNQSGNQDDKKDDPTTPSNADPTVEYTAIVLKDNGKVSCDADNVTINGNLATGGTEIIINGAGEYSKYYVTSETGTFLGKIEFRFSVGEDVEVKFNNVNISSENKTAVKFTNVDSEVDKEVDGEETGVGGTTGSDVETAVPEVELSFTGANSFKANGSGKNGTIYSECRLAIKGHGSAEIDGGDSLSGICSTESITIKNSTLAITSRAKQGISCDKKVTVNTGTSIDIESTGDGIHCNKFVFNGSADGESDSTIKIRSMNSVSCADGIDSDEQIIINGGTLDVVALTTGKYALKCRKVIKGKPNGIFTINGGTVTSAGNQNTPLQNGSQKAVLITSSKPSEFTVGNVKSESCNSFLCSPVSANSVSSSNGGTKDISWSSNKATVNF